MTDKPWLSHYPAGVPAGLKYPAMPVQGLLTEAARDFPFRTCLSLNDYQASYMEVEESTSAIAGQLVRLGVRPGEQVGLFLPNQPEFVLSFFAILKAGGVVAAFNPLYMQAEFIWQALDAGVKLVICDKAGYAMLRQIRQAAGVRRLCVVGDDVSLDAGDLHFSELRVDQRSPLPRVGLDDPAIYQYSGGTTGIPKGVIGSHRNLVANALQFRAWAWNCERGKEVLLAAIPLYHVYGMVLAMCLGMALGATLELVPNPRDTKTLLAAIQRSKPTIFPAVPGLLGMLSNLPPGSPAIQELKSLKAVISGAAPLPLSVRQRFEGLTGVTISEGFGLSEAPTATHCNPIAGENRPGSIGLPLPDVEARIVSLEDEKSAMPPGEAGELVIRAPQVMQGYLNLPKETKLALRSGWLFTGDIAVMDEQGYFTLVDRKKDLIKSGGLQVWPHEVENVLLQHPAVADAGVAGIPDEVHGETVKAWLVLNPGEKLTEAEVRAWCRKHLASFKVPRKVVFVEKLPRSGVGKLLRRELKKL